MYWHSIARRQGGVITRQQLRAAGLTRGAADSLRVRGQLLSTDYRGIYLVAGAPRGPDAQTWLTVLGSRCVLSYLSAAQWWDLPVESDGRVHVTRFDRQRFDRRTQVRVHRTLLAQDAVTRHFGVPITTRQETLLDCLGWVERPAARTLLDRSFQQSWLTRADIERRLDEQPGRWGNKALMALAKESRPGAESELERRLHHLLDDAGIGGWCANLSLVLSGRRFRVDVAFAVARVAVEVDGWAYHRSKERRDRDMLKANALIAAGWRVLTFSWEDITIRPAYVVGVIRSVLAAQTAM